MRRGEGGSAAAAVIVMLPLLLVVCTGVIQLGALRVVAAKVAMAADLATLAAVGDQDDGQLARTGKLRLSGDAAEVAREFFALNLEPIRASLAVSPRTAALAADIAVFPSAPAHDPLTGARYDRPTVRLAARVPVMAPGFGVLLLGPVATVGVRSTSAPR